MIDFVCWIVFVSLIVSFLRTLAIKWGILDWLQLNAPNDFLHKLFSCEFCQSFWLGMLVCFIISIVTADWGAMFIPFFSCNIRW